MRLLCRQLRALRHNCGSGRASAGLHGPVGTSVAFLIAIYGKAREGRRRQGIRRKPGSCKSLALGDTTHRDRITTRTTLLHTQASDRHPAQAGFFLRGRRRRCPGGTRDRATARVMPKGRGARDRKRARRRSVRCEISWGLSWRTPRNSYRLCQPQRVWQAKGKGPRAQPHFESPQLRHVMQPSIMTTATVLQRPHSCAPSGKCGLAKASACRVRAWNSARFSSTSFC